MDPARDAVLAALKNDWTRAIELNEELYKLDKNDIGALLRLAHAYFESGNTKASLNCAHKTLKLDPSNQLAKKCIEKCNIGKSTTSKLVGKKTNLKAFLENPGKTRFAHLVHLGEPKTLTGLCSGEQVKLAVNAHRVSVETTQGEHIGRLPDDIAAKMSSSKTSKYWAFIKYAGPTDVSVVIHER